MAVDDVGRMHFRRMDQGTDADFAVLAKVHEDTLERWAACGLRRYRAGRVTRYRASDIVAFMAREDGEEQVDPSIQERARRAARKIQGGGNGVRSQAG